MIPKTAQLYCCEDISLIENYERALNDENEVYVVHHRLEIELNVSGKELIEMGLYYNRPADELILLTKSEHSSLHGKHAIGELNNFYGHNHSDETKKRQSEIRKEYWLTHETSEETKKKMSDANKGEQNGFYGKTHTKKQKEKWSKERRGENSPTYGSRWMIKDGMPKPEHVNKEDIQKYLDDGWRFGRK